jgi:glycosyltransferase involved in cell wall biosynthesis
MPQPILEALATGRPIVTTNTSGCRETVDERVNGCLVPPGDPAALVAGIESILKRPDLIPHLARASRAKAERRFDERAATAAMMVALGLS